MLKCRDVAERASDLMEGGLPLGTRLGLRLHLAMCRMCRAYLDQMRRTRALMAGRGMDGLSRAEEDGLIGKIHEK